MKLTENQVVAIKRKRGELDLTIKELEQATKVSRWTLIDIFKHNHRNVNKVTFKKLNDWLINEYERSTQQ
ncbi:XRE family transcriptional regulator [Lactobacillus johnsonii]|uniref:XRE family transcriptional regulator n=1 Tax=Lactobacillus johnsonii TaxID=33959 RepID=UPI0030A8EE19